MVFTLGSFVLVTVAVAFVSWLKTKGTDETSKDGYFLGGRSLSGLVIFGSLMMTNLSAEQLVGRNGQGYAAGMTAMGWETMCPIALTLMALFFIPKYFKLGISTIPEFLESRFDRATRVIVSFIFLVAYIVTMLPLVLYAGSVAMERIFGITALMGGNRFMATTVMCVALGIIGGIYAIFGGLKAVAVSDSLNGIIFIIGAVILIPVLAFIALGDGSIAEGIRLFATSSPEHLNAIQPANAQPAVHSVADDRTWLWYQPYLLLVHQPVHHAARTRREEPEGSAERLAADRSYLRILPDLSGSARRDPVHP